MTVAMAACYFFVFSVCTMCVVPLPCRCASGFQGDRCEDVQEATANANRADEEQAIAGGENMTLYWTDLRIRLLLHSV